MNLIWIGYRLFRTEIGLIMGLHVKNESWKSQKKIWQKTAKNLRFLRWQNEINQSKIWPQCKTAAATIVPHMVKANNGFQTWHLMQTISAVHLWREDYKLAPFCLLSFFFSEGYTFITMLKTYHETQIIKKPGFAAQKQGLITKLRKNSLV